jgi:hypothetical protein
MKNKSLEQDVRRRAAGRCEYCLFPESGSTLKHVVDHILARQHGGLTEAENLALCCDRCNWHKGPNIAGIDTDTGQIVRLFHPRTDVWTAHFRWNGPRLVGLSPIGRVTIAVLSLNNAYRIAMRVALIDTGRFMV